MVIKKFDKILLALCVLVCIDGCASDTKKSVADMNEKDIKNLVEDEDWTCISTIDGDGMELEYAQLLLDSDSPHEDLLDTIGINDDESVEDMIESAYSNNFSTDDNSEGLIYYYDSEGHEIIGFAFVSEGDQKVNVYCDEDKLLDVYKKAVEQEQERQSSEE